MRRYQNLIRLDYSSSFLFFFIIIVTTPAPPRSVTTANGATAIITPVGITPSRVFKKPVVRSVETIVPSTGAASVSAFVSTTGVSFVFAVDL